MYSDGSSTGSKLSVYGYAIYKDTQLITRDGNFLPRAEVYDAEIAGAVQGKESALEIGDSTGIIVLLDNQEAVETLGSDRTKSSLQAVKKFKELRSTYPTVEVRWIPEHNGIHGDENSDTLAIRALATASSIDRNISTTENMSRERQKILTFAALK